MVLQNEQVMVAEEAGGQGVVARAAWSDLPRPRRLRVGGALGYVVALTLLFIKPLTQSMLYAARSDLHSHILLVPLVSGYLVYIGRKRLGTVYRTSVLPTAMLVMSGLAALGAAIAWQGTISLNDHLALVTLSFLSFLAAGGFLFLGSEWMAGAAFPLLFLIFMVPLPDVAVCWLERALALASAEAAALFFNVAGTPLVRRGSVLELPGIALEVGQACSGIHSSWVLFITSLLASHLVLRSPWRRILLVAFVIPLGILRNGFRILIVGLLCVHVGPQMIDSVIHHQGGPLFFALSLLPMFLLLWWLRHGEQRGNQRA